MFFVQLGLQFCLKGLMNDLWTLYFTLQIMCYLKIYDIPLPANADIYIVEITKMIEFDILHPDTIGKMVTGNDEWKLTDYLQSKMEVIQNQKETTTILEELSIIVIAAMVFLVVVIGMCFLAYFYEKVRVLIRKLIDMIFFNMIIRSITIVYIKFCIAFANQVENYIQGNKNQSYLDFCVGASLFAFSFGYPILALAIVFKNKTRLDHPKVLKRISNLYQDVKLKGRYDQNLIYYSLFLIRRIIFVAIPTFLFRYPFYQV